MEYFKKNNFDMFFTLIGVVALFHVTIGIIQFVWRMFYTYIVPRFVDNRPYLRSMGKWAGESVLCIQTDSLLKLFIFHSIDSAYFTYQLKPPQIHAKQYHTEGYIHKTWSYNAGPCVDKMWAKSPGNSKCIAQYDLFNTDN